MHRTPLDALVSRADRAGVFLDFDGTLSEIAPTPGAATAVPGAAEALVRLAERFALVAIVSGRRAAEVEERLGPLRGVRVFGLYGLEQGGFDDGVPASPPGPLEEILPRLLEAAAAVPGTLVEPKGSNLALHYRLAPDMDAARRALLEAARPLAAAARMRVIEGKRVLELVPETAPSKGDVVEGAGAGLEAMLYAGDDLADLEAFAAADRLAARGAHVVKVAVGSAETPEPLVVAADLVVPGPAALVEMLGSLAG